MVSQSAVAHLSERLADTTLVHKEGMIITGDLPNKIRGRHLKRRENWIEMGSRAAIEDEGEDGIYEEPTEIPKNKFK